uniref:Uncharacterized protein n=1 Tax=Tanacetum cinerariifolium TaxID=118510 RepID=A0A6L2N0F7_TANCI|nr:hypothetical protein [Tanacetum cinerariifolium]
MNEKVQTCSVPSHRAGKVTRKLNMKTKAAVTEELVKKVPEMSIKDKNGDGDVKMVMETCIKKMIRSRAKANVCSRHCSVDSGQRKMKCFIFIWMNTKVQRLTLELFKSIERRLKLSDNGRKIRQQHWKLKLTTI